MKKRINTDFEFISYKPYNLIGLSIVRITIGLVTLITLIANFQTRYDLWENSIFNITNIQFNHITFNIFYCVLIISLFMYTLGIENIIFNIYIYILIYILYSLNNHILDGGNNILIIGLFYMIFTKNAQYFSIYKGRRTTQFTNSLHNIFLFLILFQVCILYFFAGFSKARGYMWFEGIAPYYIFQIKTFTMAWTEELLNFIINNSTILLLISYSAIFMQLFFPILIFNRITKIIVVIGSISFHISVILIMGLVTFGMIMVAFDLLFIKDNQFMKVKEFLDRRTKFIKQKVDYI